MLNVSKRNIAYLFVLSLGLGVIFYLNSSEKLELSSRKRVFPNLKIEDINRITIDKKDEKKGFYVDLRKKGDFWFFKKDKREIRANQKRVKKILENLLAMSVTTTISKKKDKLVKYGVDDSNGAFVEIFNSKKRLGSVILGKTAQDYLNNFICKPGTHEVLLVDKYFGKHLSRPSWKEINIIEAEEEFIKSFTYREGIGKTFYFYKENGTWVEKNTKDRTLSQAATERLLGAIVRLIILRDVTKFQSNWFEPPKINIIITYQNGVKDGFIVGKTDEASKSQYVRRLSDARVFLVRDFRIATVTSIVKELVKRSGGKG